MDLVISRKLWLHGEGAFNSYLNRAGDGKMCCLGFYGLALGISAEHLKGMKNLAHVRQHAPPNTLDWLFEKVPYNPGGPNKLNWEYRMDYLMRMNDDKLGLTHRSPKTQEEREQMIADQFLKYGGVTVRFEE